MNKSLWGILGESAWAVMMLSGDYGQQAHAALPIVEVVAGGAASCLGQQVAIPQHIAGLGDAGAIRLQQHIPIDGGFVAEAVPKGQSIKNAEKQRLVTGQRCFQHLAGVSVCLAQQLRRAARPPARQVGNLLSGFQQRRGKEFLH